MDPGVFITLLSQNVFTYILIVAYILRYDQAGSGLGSCGYLREGFPFGSGFPTEYFTSTEASLCHQSSTWFRFRCGWQKRTRGTSLNSPQLKTIPRNLPQQHQTPMLYTRSCWGKCWKMWLCGVSGSKARMYYKEPPHIFLSCCIQHTILCNFQKVPCCQGNI